MPAMNREQCCPHRAGTKLHTFVSGCVPGAVSGPHTLDETYVGLLTGDKHIDRREVSAYISRARRPGRGYHRIVLQSNSGTYDYTEQTAAAYLCRPMKESVARPLHDGSLPCVRCAAVRSRVRGGGARHHGDLAALLLADAALGLARPARRRGRGAHPTVAAPLPGVVRLHHGASMH